MKRKSGRKEKDVDLSDAEEIGSTKNQDVEKISTEEERSRSGTPPEPKKKKLDTRKTASGKKSKKQPDEQEEEDGNVEQRKSPRKGKDNSEEDENENSKSEKEDDDENTAGVERSQSESPKKKKRVSRKSSVKKTKKKEESEEDDVQYEVEEVIDEKMIRGVRHYLIRWKGYDPDSDTWEPESTLECADLIRKFKEEKSNDENKSPKKGKKDETSDTPKRNKKEKNADNGVSPKKQKDDQKHKEKKSSKKRKTSKEAQKVDWESDDEFEVDRILDVYFKRSGQREFLVSWKGYSHSQASWEPEENLDCTDLIERFMQKVNKAKEVGQKELRVNRVPTERFTLNMSDGNRRLSRRLGKKQRVHYHEAQ